MALNCTKCYIRNGEYFKVEQKQLLGTIVEVFDKDGDLVTDTAIINDLQNYIKGLATVEPVTKDLNCALYDAPRRCNNSIQLENQKITFPANTIYQYDAAVVTGKAKHVEVNNLTEIYDGDSFGQPYNSFNKKLENQVEIIAIGGVTRVSWIGDCENTPTVVTLSPPIGLSYNPNPLYPIGSGMSFSPTLASDGGDAVTYKVTSGTLPDGVSFNPLTGEISGIPTEKGTYTVTVEACNSAGCATSTFTFSTDYCKENETIVIPANKGVRLGATQVFAVDFISNNGNIDMTVGDIITGVKSNFPSGTLPNDIADSGDFIANDIYLVNNSGGDLTIKVTKLCGEIIAMGDTLGGGLIVTAITYNSQTEKSAITWTDVTGEVGYKILRWKTSEGESTATIVGTVGSNVTTFTDGYTEFDVEYSYKIVAYNNVDIAESNTVAVTPYRAQFIFTILVP